jgi:hypothetical protein
MKRYQYKIDCIRSLSDLRYQDKQAFLDACENMGIDPNDSASDTPFSTESEASFFKRNCPAGWRVHTAIPDRSGFLYLFEGASDEG